MFDHQDDKLSNFFKEGAKDLENRADMQPSDSVWERLSKRLDEIPEQSTKPTEEEVLQPAVHSIEQSKSFKALYFALAALCGGFVIGLIWLNKEVDNSSLEQPIAHIETTPASPKISLKSNENTASPSNAISAPSATQTPTDHISEPSQNMVNSERAKVLQKDKETKSLEDVMNNIPSSFSITTIDSEIHKETTSSKESTAVNSLQNLPYLALLQQNVYKIVEKNNTHISIHLNTEELLTYSIADYSVTIFHETTQQANIYHFLKIDNAEKSFYFRDNTQQMLVLHTVNDTL